MFIKSYSTLALLSITILFVGTYSYIFDSKLDFNGDNANYYMLGKAIAAGEGYVNINNIQKTPNNHFPPGYPAIISGVLTIGGEAMVNLKLANGLMFLLTIFGLYFLILKITERYSTATIVVLLILLNAHLLRYSNIIMSEIPYLFFSVLAMLSFLKINYKSAVWKDPWLYLTIILLGIDFYIRTSGITIIGGILLYLFMRRKWGPALILIIGIFLLVLPWQIRSQKLGGSSYLTQLSQVNPYRPELGVAKFKNYAERLAKNSTRYLSKEIPAAVFPSVKVDYKSPVSISQWVLSLLLIVFITYGLLTLKNFRLVILAYLAGTFAILLLWPDVWIGIRFMLPIIPFLILGLVNSVATLVTKYSSKKYYRPLIWLPVLIVMPLLPTLIELNKGAKARPKASWQNYIALAKWAKEHVMSNSVIACRKPTIFYLYSNTYTVNYKYTDDPNEFMADLEAKKVDFVVLEQLGYSSTYRYLFPAVKENMERFETVQKYSDPETFLIRLLK